MAQAAVWLNLWSVFVGALTNQLTMFALIELILAAKYRN